MTVAVIKTEEQKTQHRIFNIVTNLVQLPKTRIVRNKGLDDFTVASDYEYVPDFNFAWCTNKKRYKLYILVGYTDREKDHAGYCICTVGSGLVATGFAMVYSFLHKNRAHNMTESYTG